MRIQSMEDKNTAYIYNSGRPVSEGHNTSVQAIRSEIYNDEQNEILEMQLRCIVCDSTAGHGLLFSRMSLDQMQAIQLYDN